MNSETIIEIELTIAMADWVRQEVSSGHYVSVDAAISDALSDWCEKRRRIDAVRQSV